MSSTIKQRKYDRNISSERHAASLSVKINDYVSSVPNKYWEFPGWGTREHLHASSAELDSIHKAQQHKSVSDHKLGEWPATAICTFQMSLKRSRNNRVIYIYCTC